MAKILGLDIPQGLEDAYWAVVQFANGTTQTQINKKTVLLSRQKYTNLSYRSLFVKWQYIYNGLSSTIRHNWDEYWATLPFGSLGGPDYWPGSGYSAFVYVNAPRYRAGLDLILEIVWYGDEMCLNGGFDFDLSSWYVNGGYMVWNSGRAMISSTYNTSSTLMYQDFTFVNHAYYKIEFDIINPNHVQTELQFAIFGGNIFTNKNLGSYHISVVRQAHTDYWTWSRLWLASFPISGQQTVGIDNVSVKRKYP